MGSRASGGCHAAIGPSCRRAWGRCIGRCRRAFTLLEVLVVIVVIGLLSTMIVGGFTNVVPAGREAAAVNKARIINAARVTYSLTVPDAAAQWSATLSDADRSTLLVNAGALSGSASDWLSAAGGYSLSLAGAIKAKTVLRDSTNTVLNYTD